MNVFQVMQISPEGAGLVRVRGRAEAQIDLGDSLVFVDGAGHEMAVHVIRIEAYGRSVTSLPAVYTGDLVLSTEGSLGRTGWLRRSNP